jgi:hypothetical protein
MASGLSDLQMQHLKTTNKAAELALKMELEKERLYGSLSPEEQRLVAFPKTRTPATDLKEIMSMFTAGKREVLVPDYEPGSGTPPFRPGATMSVPQQVAQGQIGNLGISQEDLIQGVLKKEMGVERPKFNRFAELEGPGGVPWVVPMNDRGVFDWKNASPKAVKPEMQKGVGEGMAQTETPTNPYTRKQVGPPILTGPPPTMQVETPTGGGGREKRVVPLFPGVSGSKVTGTTAGGIRTELDLLDIPIPASEVNKWSDGKGNSPVAGWTPRQAQGRGFKPAQEGMPAETGGKVVMLSQAIEDMNKAILMILPTGGGFNRKLAIGAGTNAPEFAVEGSQIVRSAVLNAMSAKLRMETGAQSNESEIQGIVDRYWPSGVRDNEKSARYKMTRLLNFMKDGKFIMDPKGRIVTVDPPVEKKKPGLSLGDNGAPKTWQDYKKAAGGQ